MLRRTPISTHAGAHKRPYLLKDPHLSIRSGPHLKRQGLHGVRRLLQYGKTDSKNYEHAFPILTHTDFGHQNHLNNTHWVELANYLPKRTKGAPPWFRGADTYSVLYSEQGRYEYQRYLMVARMPSEFRTHFLRYLGNIRDVSIKQFGDGRPTAIPQEVLHWLLRMIVENFNPQHIHYSAAMATLSNVGELEMASEVWKIMERQQTIPDDKLIVQYIDVLAKLREKALAIECWNRYCTEKRFLQPGEVDPKPVSRVPFSLSRDETLYLPKWKKHFDHDPNLDVVDLNRFNTTRDIYRAMAGAMLASGDREMFSYFFKELQTNLFSTPTPVPEPPNPLLTPAPTWGPHISQDVLKRSPWRAKNSLRGAAMGPSTAAAAELHRRFQSNEQFYLTSVAHFFDILSEQSPATMEVTQLYNDALAAVGNHLPSLDTTAFLTAYLRCLRLVKHVSADEALAEATKLLAKKGSKEGVPATAYLEILRCLNSKSIETETAARMAISTLQRILDSTGSTFRWSAEMHFAVMQTLVKAGTMRANAYFVNNVLRQFQWDSTFCELLYEEYRKSSSAELWAELTKRLLVWTARYDVTLSERFKRMVEEDFETIHVQVRTFRELAIFRYRDAEEKRISAQPTAQLPNTFTDYVSHALPFPDRDTGTVNEYGDLGQWRTPELGGPLKGPNGAKGPARFAPELYGESKKSYLSEWVDPRARTGLPKLPSPWDRKYAQYARGTNPSYDQVYAGPFPEIFPERFNFRRITRWDFKDIEQQSKYKFSGPY